MAGKKKVSKGDVVDHEGHVALVLHAKDGLADLVVFNNDANQVQFVKGIAHKGAPDEDPE